MRFRFIDAHRRRFRVRTMCRVLEVSRAGYYAWRQRGRSAQQQANDQLLQQIRRVYQRSRRLYGYRKVHQALRLQKVPCSRNRVARLMRLAGLRSRRRRRYRKTTRANPQQPVAPNHLDQCFTASAPNQTWLTDITYVRTGQGWLYLAAVLDLFSRRVVGWAMADYLSDRLTLKALRMALSHRRPPAGLLHHSDRGSQYTSRSYRHLLAAVQAQPSMSRSGNAYDNAPMESFFATLKCELVHRQHYQTRQEAKQDIFEFIEVFYNRQRLHAALGYRTPVDFESLAVSP